MQSMMKRIHMQKLFRLSREECGAELVEFALCASILMGLVIGWIGFASAMYNYQFVSSAAQQGVRFAMVRGHTWSNTTTTSCSTSAPPNFKMPYDCEASAADIQNYVQNLATAGITQSNVTIITTSASVWPGKTPDGTTTTCATANSQGCIVKVTVSYNFPLINAILPKSKTVWKMTATSQAAILQ